jgi:recombination protein RecA
MSTAAELRKQIESALAERIPAALSIHPATAPELVSCGIAEVDAALGGGLPLGGISELTGAASSGRTTLAWATLAGITVEGGSGAYVDVSDSFDPLSAAALGVDLRRLLWVRAGEADATVAASPLAATAALPTTQHTVQQKTGFGRGWCHPRAEVIGADRAVSRLFNGHETGGNPPSEPRDFTPRCSESIRRKRIEPVVFTPQAGLSRGTAVHVQRGTRERKPWERLDRALCATDLLLNAGGFRVVVLDLGDVSPEYVRRVPLATWYRFRLQVEKSQTLLLLLTQVACANSCAAVSLHCETPQAEWRQAAEGGPSLLTGVRYGVSIARNRAADPYRKKPAASSPHYAKNARSGGPEPSPHYAKNARSGGPEPSPHYAKNARSGGPESAQASWNSTTLWSR